MSRLYKVIQVFALFLIMFRFYLDFNELNLKIVCLDRFPDATDEQKVFYEESFKSIGEAYSVLKDTNKREAYDRSYRFGREY